MYPLYRHWDLSIAVWRDVAANASIGSYMQESCVPAVPALGPEYGGVAGRGRSPARRSFTSSQGAPQASLVVKRGVPPPPINLLNYNQGRYFARYSCPTAFLV